MELTAPHEVTRASTLDLAEIARLAVGERVEVRPRSRQGQDLFQRTLRLLDVDGGPEAQSRRAELVGRATHEYVPEDEQLRSVFLVAEAVGGYERLHDLVYAYSPGLNLIEAVRETVGHTPLRPLQLRDLRQYQEDILAALERASEYLRDRGTAQFSPDNISQLYRLLTEAQSRAEQIEQILGKHLAHELERAVERLYELREMTRSVEQTLTGIFLVDSEVLFLPTQELTECVQTIFDSVGNPYLAEHVSGITLLAARNLLIQVVAFYSYYGRHQIYNVLRRTGSNISTQTITLYIRREIRRVFAACKADNRLILRRVMREVEQDFELSVEAIQREAEESAVAAVRDMIPEEPVVVIPPRRPWWRRLLDLLR